ncbi:MAG: transcription termination/antitermination protein NusA, partial [Kofleriaceae bacterium]
KAYCLDIDRNARGPQVILSRTHKGLLEKLFEQEVPEIYEKIVRIESSAREPGARAKIAVSSRDRDVDPVGACVGMKGSRVQAVVQELRGEKIDIVPYDDDPARFVCNAIAPAEVSRVIIDAEGHRMELIVPDDKLSLAIGKKGQNVRLASQLTGWRIDIHSESKIYELERRAKEQITAAIEGAGFDGPIGDTLFKLGWRSVAELSRAAVEELAGLPGIGGPDGARRIIESAQNYISSGGGRRRDAAKVETERRSSLSGGQQLMELDGVDEDVLGVLAQANIHSPEDLIRIPIETVATSTGIDMGDLARLRQRAISWLSEVSS